MFRISRCHEIFHQGERARKRFTLVNIVLFYIVACEFYVSSVNMERPCATVAGALRRVPVFKHSVGAFQGRDSLTTLPELLLEFSGWQRGAPA